MSGAAAATALVALLSCTATYAASPLALHRYFVVDAGSYVVIPLYGYDLDGDNLQATITFLPESGTLHQITDVFNKYGYSPVAGNEITTVGTAVTGSQNRVVYKRPTFDSMAFGKWSKFEYTVSDGGSTSLAGTVWLLPSTMNVEGSDFTLSSESWTIVGQSAPQQATYEQTSTGILNRFIYGTDSLIQKTSASCDANRWMFEAPSKFLGLQGVAYGGSLEFTLSSFSGDFSAGNLVSDLHLVEMECSSCATNTGVLLAFPLSATTGFDGKATVFSISLSESGGWLKDPKNTLDTWLPPSKCDMLEVLGGLTSLRIAGDFTCWYESVAVDNVSFKAPVTQIPICAQGVPDLSSCTCT